MTAPQENLGDRIRARRDARTALLTDELKRHIDQHFEILHARLDEMNTPKP